MNILKRIFYALLVLIVLAAGIGFLMLNRIKHRAIPDYNENIELTGLKSEVQVIRDEYAIPHVYAENEHDLYMAVGYIMAQDRLWQMDLLRRVTTGRLSEIFGKDMVKTDALMRSLQMTEKTKSVLAQTDQHVLDALDAFASGVNQYIQNNKRKLPPEFGILRYKPEPWTKEHSVNLIGYMAWDLTMAWSSEILLDKLARQIDSSMFMDLIPDINVQKTSIFPEGENEEIDIRETILAAVEPLQELGIEVFSGSNNWAVSGKKSTTGQPILANDMHLGLFAPGIWYQMHQVIEGKLNVTGVVLPGQPMVISGHNDSIAWGMTNVMLDDMDFYAETINPENNSEYMLNGQWKPLKILNEQIITSEGDTIEKTLQFTHRGPIISDHKGIDMPVSMKWIGFEYSNELTAVYKLNHGKNYQDFREAAKEFIAISQNIIYADKNGNIALQTCAGVPIRAGNGIEIYPGDTTAFDWTGIVPFEQLPNSFNPESGHLSSANNKTTDASYPYYISYWFDLPHRADRIIEMLEEKEKISPDDFERIHGDFKSKQVERTLPIIMAQLEMVDEMTNTEVLALDALRNWDGILIRESIATSIYEILYLNILKETVRDEMGEELLNEFLGNKIMIRNLLAKILVETNSKWFDDITTDEKENSVDIIYRAFKNTVNWLVEEKGESLENWEWQSIHKFTLEHPMGKVEILNKVFKFNRGPFGMPGSYHTVCPYSYSYKNPYVVNHGASQRHIYDFADFDNSRTVIPTGTSGIPASKYYCDQTELYIHNKYHKDLFSRETVTSNAVYEMKITPKK